MINDVKDVRDSLRRLRDQMIEHLQEFGGHSNPVEFPVKMPR